MTTSYIIHYLPTAIIGLLLVVVAMLAWMLIQANHGKKALMEKFEQLQAKLQQEQTLHMKPEIAGITLEKLDEVPDNVFLAHVDQLITRNMEKSEFTAATIAQVLHLSRTQLDRRMKQLAGKTATTYLLDRRMTYARELLLTTRMPVADVAMASGFEDTSYFSRVFKQHHGNTPSGMRN
jgi:AraC-like DNA-binding protein